jgi:hypothetical protein
MMRSRLESQTGKHLINENMRRINMKRNKGELRYDFCARRLMDLEEAKAKLAGTLVHCSVILVESAKEEHLKLPRSQRPLVKVKAQGTYVKPIKEVT